MYSRLRTSLKQRGGNNRKTLKQRGGYAPAYATPDEARKAEWITASVGTPLETLVTALCNAPTVQTYIEAIARQDDLFLLAHRLAFKDFITGDAINIQTLLTTSPTSYTTTTLPSYINDVHKWVAFKAPDVKAGKLATLKNIPIQQIILYPNVLTNSFLSAVAACFVQMKQQKIVFSGPADPKFVSMKEFYAFDFNGSTKELIYKQTRSEQRDGFYLGQTISEVKAKMDTFWTDVIDTLRTPEASLFTMKSKARADYAAATKTDASAAAAAACRDFFAADSWGAIAASLYMLYNGTDKWSLQTLLNAFFVANFDATDKCASPYVKDLLAKYADKTTTNVPPEGDWNTGLLTTNTTLMMLLTQIDLSVLDFLLHLTQKIIEVTASASVAPTS